MRTRCFVAVLFCALTLVPLMAWAQPGPAPPNFWHPFRGGPNCIQVSDAQGNFNCAPGTRVDPATGNMTIAGSLTFGTGGASFAPGGLALTTNTSAQVIAAGDLVIQTSPPTVLASGPLIQGVTLRVRSVSGGGCQLVVAGGNGVGEFAIPVVAISGGYPLPNLAANRVSFTYDQQLMLYFPGGPSGC